MTENELVCPKCGSNKIAQLGLAWRRFETVYFEDDEIYATFMCECGHTFQKYGMVKWTVHRSEVTQA